MLFFLFGGFVSCCFCDLLSVLFGFFFFFLLLAGGGCVCVCGLSLFFSNVFWVKDTDGGAFLLFLLWGSGTKNNCQKGRGWRRDFGGLRGLLAVWQGGTNGSLDMFIFPNS